MEPVQLLPELVLLGSQPLYLDPLLLSNDSQDLPFHLAETSATLGTLRLMDGERNSTLTGPYMQATALAYLRRRKSTLNQVQSDAVEVVLEPGLFAFWEAELNGAL